MGDILIYDIENAQIINQINRRDIGIIYSIDISMDDSILAVGYENSKMELIDLNTVNNDKEAFSADSVSTVRYVMRSYKTQQTSLLRGKFTYENLLLGISIFAPESR